MQSVLMSIRPEYIQKIALREKEWELRKILPRLPTPYKVYMYCAKTKWPFRLQIDGDAMSTTSRYTCGGEVVGEFVCDRIETAFIPHGGDPIISMSVIEKSGLTVDQIEKYSGGKPVYALGISWLKIYLTPKQITDFKRWNRTEENAPCAHMKWLYEPCSECKECNLDRPPQGWCYVEAD